MLENVFKSSLGLRFSPAEVVKEIIRYMQAEPNHAYALTIGTDSMKLANEMADFVTAIVVHLIGRGGRYFSRRIDQAQPGVLRDRIIEEVVMSLDVATSFLKQFQDAASTATLPKYSFAIHVDVGENGETKKLIAEVIGMVRGMNFEARMKPESYAASNIADRHT